VSTLFSDRLARLTLQPELLRGSLRGIEKEGLRVDAKGLLSTHPHPQKLGSALTHPRITTDYSEALLELITGTHSSVDSLIAEITEIQTVVDINLGDELMWNHSMPAHLPAESDIPIAWYGTSNTGMLKHVYRRGLAQRYGKTMQCIAGLHYNFSFSEVLWEVLALPGAQVPERRSAGYLWLIRNFTRYSWLLMYLFGASPAVSKDFLRGRNAGLESLDADTFYLPYATSLRMSDLGYQNKAQSSLKLCFNDLNTFLQRIYDAVTTPWPAYQSIGTHRDGDWIQLNTNILQIENEFYSSIRPKRTTGSCERPITALNERGVQYIEVRCLDIDHTQPAGISAETARFVDAFLLFCATHDSPLFADDGFCAESADNFSRTVKLGRQPNLTLKSSRQDISLQKWALDLVSKINDCAHLLADSLVDEGYRHCVAPQIEKINNPEATPSAHLLSQLRQTRLSFHDFALNESLQHAQRLKAAGLSSKQATQAEQEAADSLIKQKSIENADEESFDAYVARFHEALKAPH
jgi:glutamate--cysteine ligase